MRPARKPARTLSQAEAEAHAPRLRAWIEASAREAATDPQKAAQLGISPQHTMTLFSDSRATAASRADWLRGRLPFCISVPG